MIRKLFCFFSRVQCAYLPLEALVINEILLQVETLLASKLMEVDISAPLSKVHCFEYIFSVLWLIFMPCGGELLKMFRMQKFACCLALLPKAHGDAASWNSLFRRILHAINSHLDDAFLGMEDGQFMEVPNLNIVFL